MWDEDGPGLDELVRAARVDVVFLALHGRGGEDGCVQGLLELMGIPYTGSGVLSSALAMDKLKAKEMFRLHNVPTPPYYVAARADLDDLEEVHGSFGFPSIVKPRREGSSVGLAKASSLAELAGGPRPRRSPSTATRSSSASCAPRRCTWASSTAGSSAPSRSCRKEGSTTTAPSTRRA